LTHLGGADSFTGCRNAVVWPDRQSPRGGYFFVEPR